MGQMIPLILGLIVLIIIFILIRTQSGSVFDSLTDIIAPVKIDTDKDGLNDRVDKCPCSYGTVTARVSGCPEGYSDEQIKQETQTYNSDTKCGILDPEKESTDSKSTTEKPASKNDLTKPKEESAVFPHFRSIEIFGNTAGGEVHDERIWQACVNWVGAQCPTRDGNCNGDNFNFDSKIKTGCWIMAVEDDWTDDCGQAIAIDGTTISQSDFAPLGVDVGNTYQSVKGNEADPKELFSWNWKSKSDYGSLLCYQGFWYGCKEEANEGKDFTSLINGQKYRCQGGEWTKV